MEATSFARHVVIDVDGSDADKIAVLWAAQNVVKPDDELHLVTVRVFITFVNGRSVENVSACCAKGPILRAVDACHICYHVSYHVTYHAIPYVLLFLMLFTEYLGVGACSKLCCYMCQDATCRDKQVNSSVGA